MTPECGRRFRLPTKSVIAFAGVVLLLLIFTAYGTDHDGAHVGGDFDELVLQHPVYAFAHVGPLVLPPAWFAHDADFHLAAHPPVHTGAIGLLIRLGFSLYYAEATPAFLLFVFCLMAIVTSRFPPPLQLGLLFGIGFLATTGETMILIFGTRPEGEICAAWLLGLVLLESGRLDGWNRRRLFAGAFFLTWASGVHFYACLAFTGVAVYIVWAVLSLGWRGGRSRVLAMCAAGCLFGIPYLAFFLIPLRQMIAGSVQAIAGSGNAVSSGSSGSSIAHHLALYSAWVQDATRPALLRIVMSLGVPLVVFSTALLAPFRVSRGLALAALPLQLTVLLLSSHQAEYYLLPECVFFAAALSAGLLLLLDFALRRLRPALCPALPPCAAALLCVFLFWHSPMLANASLSLTPKVSEVEIARAASRQILGPHACVTGLESTWFSSGAEHWTNLKADMDPGSFLYNPKDYLSNFDAIAAIPYQSDFNATTVAPWYADGTLKLRGFYLGQTNDQMRIVFLSARAPTQVVGYAARDGQLYRFQQEAGGDYEVLSAVCPPDRLPWLTAPSHTFSSVLRFTGDSPYPNQLLVTILAPRAAIAPEGPIGAACREISKLPGVLQFADKAALLNALRRDAPPVHLYRILDDMPGFTGLGLPASVAPPPGLTPIPSIVDLSKAIPHAPGRIQSGPPLRIITATGMGIFSGMIPIANAGTVVGPCWVALRLRVISGRMGFAVFDARTGILVRTAQFGRSLEPQTIALRVPDFRTATHIVIFNESQIPEGGIVEILDAAILH